MKSASTIVVPFGPHFLEVSGPLPIETLRIRHRPPLDSPAEELRRALDRPLGTRPLREIIAEKGVADRISVAIAVSDITRPVPYKGPDGVLLPLLGHLHDAGVTQENILLIVATGMHRRSTAAEKRFMLGPEVVDRYAIVDHDCEDRRGLVALGQTPSAANIAVNRHFAAAQLKICTGLVESHFMAGFSGGRKSICPGLVDRTTIEQFHGPAFLENPAADNLILGGNPCHDEALRVARSVGVDFIVNVTVDAHFRITGIYAGDLEKAHLRASIDAGQEAALPIDRAYDIVLTHGGYVGRTHYQAAKAAVGALPAVGKGGTLIIVANNDDPDPVGTPEYRTLLHLLKIQGPDGYAALLRSPSWRFTKDQWEPQMWGKVIRRVGEDNLIYCAPQIPLGASQTIPGLSGHTFIDHDPERLPLETARTMVEKALYGVANRFLTGKGRSPSVAYIADGPYAVPVRRPWSPGRDALRRG